MDKLMDTIMLAKPESDIGDFLTATDLYGQGMIDSLDIIIILDEICAAYGIEISGADIRREDFMTLESIYALIKRKGGDVI